MKKIALYCRVSLSDGTQSTSNQRLRLVDYAERNGFSYDIYEEQESSRKTRPIKQSLLAKLRAGEYDSIVVYRLDRWARSSTELILETKELLDKGVSFVSISDNLDFGTASGKLHFAILSAFAEFERELIRERTLLGLQRARQEGKRPGRPIGSKDSVKRKRAGYILREAQKRQKNDGGKGIHKPIEQYLN